MISTRTRVIALPLAGVLLFGAGQLTARSAAADADASATDAKRTGCSTDMLKGRYILSGGGTIAGDEFDTIINIVMDGKGTITEGLATVVLQRVAVAEHITIKNASYSVDENCAGKLKFFAVHNTEILAPYDHVHETEILVFDGGRQFSLINLTTEVPGAPNVMSEAFRFTAHRV